jgi:hypothetical protein
MFGLSGGVLQNVETLIASSRALLEGLVTGVVDVDCIGWD